MGGSFKVSEVYQGPRQHFSGEVVSGRLMPGMEARLDGNCLVIIQIIAQDRDTEPLQKAHRGDRVILDIGATAADLSDIKGTILNFDELRSISLKKGFFLKPDPTA
ncbi:MAG: hypothetical protein A3B31_02845 [Candidatus Komeilibacteria bacterium RIFCSPLOWO2_01_FULL_53_11]|uniref:Translation elongation factor EFTu-like domain-containing protein n=1 Tax=Candidatus Komeilibacteria bacterium RIFCSPLOWO2_01_FULL_53_11 TaxID=1798552 RepID=A0A1G2BUP2_9BACT|nr:MAG: hypothetical protein A3B31_02845 [Candidatus Komeilibacteria bacterium RIFCSPLOWO2_01_FULL_53_11]